MSQFIYTMIGVSKVVPPNRTIIRDISLSFFPGAKIGLLGLNGAGKSTLLKAVSGPADIVSGTLAAAQKIDDGSAVNLGTMERIRVIDASQDVRRVHEAIVQAADPLLQETRS